MPVYYRTRANMLQKDRLQFRIPALYILQLLANLLKMILKFSDFWLEQVVVDNEFGKYFLKLLHHDFQLF